MPQLKHINTPAHQQIFFSCKNYAIEPIVVNNLFSLHPYGENLNRNPE